MFKVRTAVITILLWAFAPSAYAAMSEAAARDKARALFGDRATIAKEQSVLSPASVYKVSVTTTGCQSASIVLGSGASWEAAFADWAGKTTGNPALVGGPFKGVIHFYAVAWDNDSVAGVQWIVDAAPFEVSGDFG